MNDQPRSESVSHEDLADVKERVASAEAKLDSLATTQARLVEGQGEILNAVDSMKASSLDAEKFHREYRPQIAKNTRHRTLAKGGAGLMTVLASLLSASWVV